MNRIVYTLLLAAALVCQCSSSAAGTIRVEKDGTGDYATIQEGIDAAAPGDSILVGPGRYDTFQLVQGQRGGWVQVVGYVVQPHLTIIGNDADSVVVGPQQRTGYVDGVQTAGFLADVSAVGLELAEITSEHTIDPVTFSADSCTVRNSTLRDGAGRSLSSAGNRGITVENVMFSGEFAPDIVFGTGTTGLRFIDCRFVGPHADKPTNTLALGGCHDVEVLGCYFEGYASSVNMWGGGSVRVSGSTFAGHRSFASAGDVSVVAVRAVSGITVVMEDNTIGSDHATSVWVNNGTLAGSGNLLLGATHTTLRIDGSAGTEASFHNNQIFKGGTWSAHVECDGTVADDAIDLSSNDWGSDDVALIWDWILSANDYPELFPDYVDPIIEPILDPVSTSPTPVSRMKGRYRGGVRDR